MLKLLIRTILKEEAIEVEALPVGAVLERGDFYFSTVGKWEPCPCPGLRVPEGSTASWVRPVNT